MKPLNDNVIFRRLEDKAETEFGLQIVSRTNRSQFGICVAAGPDACVQPGQQALIGTKPDATVKVDGETLVVMKNENIMAVVEE